MMRERGETNPKNTSCNVQVLGVGTDTGVTVPSVLLFFDRHRYLFNVGEGFQRFCVDHKVKLSKVGTVLMTRVTTEASGGLPGVLITMSDTGCGGLLAGHDSITLHGPTGLTTLVNAFRTFVNVKDMGLRVAEFGETGQAMVEPVVRNEVVTITPVLIRAQGTAAAAAEAQGSRGDGSADGSGEPEAKRARHEAPAGGAAGMDIPSVSVESPAACYVCELPAIPGKFLPQKAVSLGVPKGPMFGKLSRGESVTVGEGRVVTPEEVMEPSMPGPVVLVVDCPSEAFVAPLTSSPALNHWAKPENRSKVAVMVHLAERSVTRLPQYREWMGSFGPDATHMLVGESQGTGVPTVKGFATMQTKLNTLDATLFPLLHLGDSAGGEAGDELGEGCVVGANMLRYNLRPVAKRGLDSADCTPALDVAAVQQQFRSDSPQVFQALEEAKQGKSEAAGEAPVPACVSIAGREELEVTFLGTGAAVPSKYRNVTSIFVNLFDKGCLLMDAGEGAYSQLRRRFGPAQADAYVSSLRVIWISHIHADHHVGLPTLLAARTRLLGPDCPPLLVLGPRPLRRALQVYAQLEPMRFRFLEAANSAVPGPGMPPVPEDAQAAVDAVRSALGLARFESVRVKHCAHAYALLLEAPPKPGSEGGGEATAGWKLVFSADTRPCDALVEAAKGATIFIHEATFDDSLHEEAVAKNHSTIGEAVAAGAAAGAYLTMLTHFSQRYPKLPVIDHNFIKGNIGIAFDLMSLNLADLPRVPLMVPALGVMFPEEEEEAEAMEEAE